MNIFIFKILNLVDIFQFFIYNNSEKKFYTNKVTSYSRLWGHKYPRGTLLIGINGLLPEDEFKFELLYKNYRVPIGTL